MYRLGWLFRRNVQVSDKQDSPAAEHGPTRGTASRTDNRVQKRPLRRPRGLRGYFLRPQPDEENKMAVDDETVRSDRVKEEIPSDDTFTGNDRRGSSLLSTKEASSDLERPPFGSHESHQSDPDTPMPSVEGPDDGTPLSSDDRGSSQARGQDGNVGQATPSPARSQAGKGAKERQKRPRRHREPKARKGWSQDERNLRVLISRLGREPVLPLGWKVDFPNMPYQVFTQGEEEAVVRSLRGSQFRGELGLCCLL